MEKTTIEEIETVEEGEESEKWMENDIIEERIEGEVVKDWIEGETAENWIEENLKEFEEVGKKLITKILCWHDGTARNIRAVYTGNSRTTIWRKKPEKRN